MHKIFFLLIIFVPVSKYAIGSHKTFTWKTQTQQNSQITVNFLTPHILTYMCVYKVKVVRTSIMKFVVFQNQLFWYTIYSYKWTYWSVVTYNAVLLITQGKVHIRHHENSTISSHDIAPILSPCYGKYALVTSCINTHKHSQCSRRHLRHLDLHWKKKRMQRAYHTCPE